MRFNTICSHVALATFAVALLAVAPAAALEFIQFVQRGAG